MPRLFLLLPLVLLAGCSLVSPKEKVRDGLLKAGVPPRIADCMAPRLAAKLSTDQLHELHAAAKAGKQEGGGASIDAVLERLRATGDPRLVKVVTKAALVCAIAG